MEENSLYDKKSLREIIGKSADWNEVAKDCVAFSNAQGGVIDYGIEDDADAPPADQKVSEEIAINLEKKISGKTQNVSVHAEIRTHENGFVLIFVLIYHVICEICGIFLEAKKHGYHFLHKLLLSHTVGRQFFDCFQFPFICHRFTLSILYHTTL